MYYFFACAKYLTISQMRLIIVVRNEYATGIGYAEKSYL